MYSGLEVVTQQFVDDAHAAHMAVWVWFNGNDDDVPSGGTGCSTSASTG